MTRKVNIRKGTFETNSSSTHSICIASGDCKDTLSCDRDGKVLVEGGCFGWEVEDYWDAETKAAYCLTWLRNYGGKQCGKYDKMLREVIRKYVQGCKEVELERWSNEWNSPDHKHYYIDHQSSDVCAEAFENEETLKQFIFNSNSLLHTDNDNRW